MVAARPVESIREMARALAEPSHLLCNFLRLIDRCCSFGDERTKHLAHLTVDEIAPQPAPESINGRGIEGPPLLLAAFPQLIKERIRETKRGFHSASIVAYFRKSKL